jgi:hypothetical protein
MSRAAFFALAALVPAIVGVAPASTGQSMLVPICAGGGQMRLMLVPLDEPALPGSDPASCCVKGCHAAGSRKRGGNQLVP